MRIALFHNLPSGGAKRHTLEQVRELARRGHQIVEYAPSTADVGFCSFEPYVAQRHVFAAKLPRPLARRVPFVTPYVHALQGLSILRRTAQLNKQIAHAIDDAAFDVALVKDCHLIMNPYVLRYLQTQSVFQCHHGLRHRVETKELHGLGADSFRSRLKGAYFAPARMAYERRFQDDEATNMRSASRVLTNSNFSRSLISKQYGVNASIIYPGINTEVFYPAPLAKLNYVLCVGALIYSKGYRFLVSALGRIAAARRPRLFIAANSIDGAEAEAVRVEAARQAVELHIETITDDQRLREVYSQALAFIYAPVQEALGMAPLEALACGTPVVAVAEGGVRETIIDGVTGWTVDRDERVFADRVEALLSDAACRQSFADNGVAQVRSQWTWQAAVDQLERHLEGARAA